MSNETNTNKENPMRTQRTPPIKPGDKIRSFDFANLCSNGEVYGTEIEGQMSAFVEGVVTDITDGTVTFDLTRHVFQGEDITQESIESGWSEMTTQLKKRGKCRLSFGGLVVIGTERDDPSLSRTDLGGCIGGRTKAPADASHPNPKAGDLVKYNARFGRVKTGRIVGQDGCLLTTPIWIIETTDTYKNKPIRELVLAGDVLEVEGPNRDKENPTKSRYAARGALNRAYRSSQRL